MGNRILDVMNAQNSAFNSTEQNIQSSLGYINQIAQQKQKILSDYRNVETQQKNLIIQKTFDVQNNYMNRLISAQNNYMNREKEGLSLDLKIRKIIDDDIYREKVFDISKKLQNLQIEKAKIDIEQAKLENPLKIKKLEAEINSKKNTSIKPIYNSDNKLSEEANKIVQNPNIDTEKFNTYVANRLPIMSSDGSINFKNIESQLDLIERYKKTHQNYNAKDMYLYKTLLNKDTLKKSIGYVTNQAIINISEGRDVKTTYKVLKDLSLLAEKETKGLFSPKTITKYIAEGLAKKKVMKGDALNTAKDIIRENLSNASTKEEVSDALKVASGFYSVNKSIISGSERKDFWTKVTDAVNSSDPKLLSEIDGDELLGVLSDHSVDIFSGYLGNNFISEAYNNFMGNEFKSQREAKDFAIKRFGSVDNLKTYIISNVLNKAKKYNISEKEIMNRLKDNVSGYQFGNDPDDLFGGNIPDKFDKTFSKIKRDKKWYKLKIKKSIYDYSYYKYMANEAEDDVKKSEYERKAKATKINALNSFMKKDIENNSKLFDEASNILLTNKKILSSIISYSSMVDAKFEILNKK